MPAVPKVGVPDDGRLPERAVQALQEGLGRQDPGDVGVLLSGSAARGLATSTSTSDVDVYVVTDAAGAPPASTADRASTRSA